MRRIFVQINLTKIHLEGSRLQKWFSRRAESMTWICSRSFFVGDKAIDIDCGRNAGVRTVLVRTGYGHSEKCTPDWTAENLTEAVEIILKQAR